MNPCGKVQYTDYNHAAEKVKHIQRGHRVKNQRYQVLRPFRCARCDHWHLGSTKRQTQRGK